MVRPERCCHVSSVLLDLLADQGLYLQDGASESVYVCCRCEKIALDAHKLNEIKEEN